MEGDSGRGSKIGLSTDRVRLGVSVEKGTDEAEAVEIIPVLD